MVIEKITKFTQINSKISNNQKMLKNSLEKIFKTIYNRVILIKKEPHLAMRLFIWITLN